jgi:hypothetical protein
MACRRVDAVPGTIGYGAGKASEWFLREGKARFSCSLPTTQKDSSVSCFTRFISEKQQGRSWPARFRLRFLRDRSSEYRLSDNECAYLCGSLCEYISIRLGCHVLIISHLLVGAGSDTVSPLKTIQNPKLISDGNIVRKRHQYHHYGRSSIPGRSKAGSRRIRQGRRSRST